MLVQQHNQKEEGMLYPMAQQALSSNWPELKDQIAKIWAAKPAWSRHVTVWPKTSPKLEEPGCGVGGGSRGPGLAVVQTNPLEHAPTLLW